MELSLCSLSKEIHLHGILRQPCGVREHIKHRTGVGVNFCVITCIHPELLNKTAHCLHHMMGGNILVFLFHLLILRFL